MAFFHASSRPRLFITSRARPDVYDFATTAEDDSGALYYCCLSIYFLDYLLFVFHKEIEKAANDEYVSHVLSTLKQMKSSGHDKHVSMGSGQGFRGAVQLRHLSWSYAKANQLFMTGDQLSPTP
ncbi:Phosphoglucosamine mutase [Trichinella pseudospiralis]